MKNYIYIYRNKDGELYYTNYELSNCERSNERDMDTYIAEGYPSDLLNRYNLYCKECADEMSIQEKKFLKKIKKLLKNVA